MVAEDATWHIEGIVHSPLWVKEVLLEEDAFEMRLKKAWYSQGTESGLAWLGIKGRGHKGTSPSIEGGGNHASLKPCFVEHLVIQENAYNII